MCEQTTSVQLNTKTIMNLPIHNYIDEFVFVVNGKNYKTTCLIADLLSPIICKIHNIDPTLNTYIINTSEKGHFSYVLDLINFEPIKIPMNEANFINEVIEILGNNSIEMIEKINPQQITKENVFSLISKHEKNESFFAKQLSDEIDFISVNFYYFCESCKKNFFNISIDTLLRIVNNPIIQLNDEDQLLNFVNYFYSQKTEYAILYESVFFSNISSKAMLDFINNIKFNDLNQVIWKELSERIKSDEQTQKYSIKLSQTRYEKSRKEGIFISPDRNKEFNGIFKYLVDKSHDDIENEVNFSASSFICVFKPSCITEYNPNLTSRDLSIGFRSDNKPNSWCCFDFKDHKVSLTHYEIQCLYNEKREKLQPKNWVIEGSSDNNSWEIIDKQENCPYFKNSTCIHTFTIKNGPSKEFKYIRIRQTGPNWSDSNILEINSLEIYGKYI